MLGHAPVAASPLSAFGALQSSSITGSGGVLVGGVATTLRGRAITATGGLQASGAATLRRGRVITGSGGLRIGGYGFFTIPLKYQLRPRYENLRLVPAAESLNVTPRYENLRVTAKENNP